MVSLGDRKLYSTERISLDKDLVKHHYVHFNAFVFLRAV